MPPVNNVSVGKPGTITAEEFTALKAAVDQWGAKLLASKVAKICSKKGTSLVHEFATSAIGAAYNAIASSITAAVGSPSGLVSSAFNDSLTQMVATYGPEVVIFKLAKLAGKAGNSADQTLLKGLFSKSSSAVSSAGMRPAAACSRRRPSL